MRALENRDAHHRPALALFAGRGAFLATFMVMCGMWFLVTELQSELAGGRALTL